jgi:putative ATP-dependent endonuclease of the OLD family
VTSWGVRTSDNLEGADVILVVEGSEDQLALSALLAARSARLRRALASGSLHMQPLYGSGNLNYILAVIRDSLCLTHAFLDDDEAGRAAAERARAQGFLAPGDHTFANRLGMANTELEDLYDPAVYHGDVLAEFNVDATLNVGKAKNRKWSDRMRLRFEASGQTWDDAIEAALKAVVNRAVAGDPGKALTEQGTNVITALASVLDRKLIAARR